jgi:hypothetical protein
MESSDGNGGNEVKVDWLKKLISREVENALFL